MTSYLATNFSYHVWQFWDTPSLESTYNHTENQNRRRNEGRRKINQTTPLLFCFVLFQFFSFSQTLYTFSLHFIFIFSFCSSSVVPFFQTQVATAAAGRSRSFEKSQYSPLYSSSLIQVCIFYILCTFKEISLTLSFISSPLSIAFCVLCFAIFYQYLCIILSV